MMANPSKCANEGPLPVKAPIPIEDISPKETDNQTKKYLIIIQNLDISLSFGPI